MTLHQKVHCIDITLDHSFTDPMKAVTCWTSPIDGQAAVASSHCTRLLAEWLTFEVDAVAYKGKRKKRMKENVD